MPGRLATATVAARFWNVHPDERRRPFGCDDVVGSPTARAVRGIDVDAPPVLLFRWLGQLRVAPYSYDWIDNLGRRSPRTLTPGLRPVAVGDHVLIGDVVDVVPDVAFTVLTAGRSRLLFGEIALTYEVVARGAAGSRLLCCLAVRETGPVRRLLQDPLLRGDAIMMRQQFLVLKECAERDAARTTG